MLVASGTPSDQCKPGQLAKITSRIVLAVPKAITYSELPVESVLRYTERAEVLERALAFGLRAVYSGHADIAVPDWDAEPFNPENFKIVSHVQNGSWRWDISKLGTRCGISENRTIQEVIDDLKGDNLTLLNGRIAESLVLNEYPVPEGWWDHHVLFPGTIFLDNDGRHFVRGVYCDVKKKRTPFIAHCDEHWRSSWCVGTLEGE